ncbi:diacylglycerol kinase family protein [Adlercreutzia sp. R21]|uniref:diacylglycerol/lipid kinase family protein n=1 Tax=Adlercreutzia wanghongyangiae TaxID=3111451 RepID=UPI002DBA93FE|nr:diacylglycerol kinase family protein [Adlercreutzia sp. R21]MEC4183195.1 diacylglycerol kinase family protein [Adlercreutzia sp. R21]
MKLLIVNNLSSGFRDGAIYDFVRAFADDGDEICMRCTNGCTDLAGFLQDAEEFDAVVAAGGDGTVATTAYLLAETGIPLLPFPAGTANLLALNLASPAEPHALAKIMRRNLLMDFDIGEIELSDGQHFGFTMIAGAGYDATIMQGAEASKRLLGPMAYFTSAFANPAPQFSQITLTIDGETVRTQGVGVLVVNFSKLQFDISVVHENKPRDGMFDVVVMNTHDAVGLIPALLSCMLDRTGEFPTRPGSLEVHRGCEVTVQADPPLAVQYDGEVTGTTTPFTARLLPEAARFVVSEECLALYDEESAEPLRLD